MAPGVGDIRLCRRSLDPRIRHGQAAYLHVGRREGFVVPLPDRDERMHAEKQRHQGHRRPDLGRHGSVPQAPGRQGRRGVHLPDRGLSGLAGQGKLEGEEAPGTARGRFRDFLIDIPLRRPEKLRHQETGRLEREEVFALPHRHHLLRIRRLLSQAHRPVREDQGQQPLPRRAGQLPEGRQDRRLRPSGRPSEPLGDRGGPDPARPADQHRSGGEFQRFPEGVSRLRAHDDSEGDLQGRGLRRVHHGPERRSGGEQEHLAGLDLPDDEDALGQVLRRLPDQEQPRPGRHEESQSDRRAGDSGSRGRRALLEGKRDQEHGARRGLDVIQAGDIRVCLPGGAGFGVFEKVREAILGCALAFEVHSPLEGESMKPSGLCEG